MVKDKDKIEANKIAWGKLAEIQYQRFSELFNKNKMHINPYVEKELGDIKGKKILHLQCNTGADSILLARKGALVTGVDIVDDNIYYAKKMAEEQGISNIEFIASDVLELTNVLEGKFDIIVTFDGVIGWLPDLNAWGKVLGCFLKDDGYFYLHDSHPFFLIFDEAKLPKGVLDIKYPYFDKGSDFSELIGGYASDAKKADNYFWGHSMSTIINGLLTGGLYITYINEYDRCVEGMGGTTLDKDGMSYYPDFEQKLPIILSIKAKKIINK